ncbi:MAG TPA: glycosyltransferase [Acidimicrobiales bacterium]|nr:glycosyltransferase [Acidimicrobiales bacterium]
MTVLLVASAGGHLKELQSLLPRLGLDGPFVWLTFDTAQSRSLLAGQEVVFGRYPRPRDLGTTAANALVAARLLRSRRFSVAVSTGSGIAISSLPLARARGASCHYIESATRTMGPSMTGRVLKVLPGMNLYTQYRAWATGPWRYGGSIFDGFTPVAGSPGSKLRRVVVSVGSSETYGFRRLIKRMHQLLPPDVDVLWQTGSTDVTGLPIDSRAFVPARELEAAMRDADVVVCHAGAGSSLVALESGRFPVLVPRQKAFGEHIDDHQAEIASDLASRGLAISRLPETLIYEDLLTCASRTVESVAEITPFELRK